ncbi:MAG TPA: hypothetical protein VFS51_06670 [Gemmatimonadales bacterium]|nr:hypothetical protein [Gemmatimonadales bacterium]
MVLGSRHCMFAVLLSAAFVACVVPPTAKPPLARHKLVQRALADTSFRWQQHTTRHFQLYAPADSYAAARLPALGQRAEEALAANLQLLGSGTYPRLPMYLVFVSSRPEMTRLVGQPAGGYAEPGEDSAFFIVTPTGSVPFRHELMHVLSFGLWGQPAQPEAWVVEGLGTLAPGRCGPFSLHQLAAALADEGRLVPLDTLMGYTYANTNDVVIYAESASFLTFVHERYGPAALRQLWQQSLTPTAAHLGTTPAILEAAWRARLAAIPAADRRVDWNHVRTNGCE